MPGEEICQRLCQRKPVREDSRRVGPPQGPVHPKARTRRSCTRVRVHLSRLGSPDFLDGFQQTRLWTIVVQGRNGHENKGKAGFTPGSATSFEIGMALADMKSIGGTEWCRRPDRNKPLIS